MDTFEEKVLDVLAEMRQEMNSMRQEMATKADLENEILKANIRIETDVIPKLDALAEGHAAILEQLTPRCRMDDMENEIKFMKRSMLKMAEELDRLKQAQ